MNIPVKKALNKLYRYGGRLYAILRAILVTPKEDLVEKPIYVFNHVPKCGGTSLLNIFRNWFVLVRDYPPHDVRFPDPVQLKKEMEYYVTHPVVIMKFNAWHILAGHYHDSPFQLNDRYSQVLKSERIRLIAFLRDPMEHRLSMYHFSKNRNHNYTWIRNVALNDFMIGKYLQNYFARALNCTENDYEQVLEKYFFIGIVEDYNNSLIKLAKKMRRPLPKKVPHLNKTESTSSVMKTDFDVVLFRQLNELDYKIYEYAKLLLKRS